ncbi:DNA replication and repair protein RadC [Baia soyae]|uniref:DNA replication and repair protein RadC n=2 Tax=Baia soyae TaxID=1544746 RepID=A0A4V6NRT0_9BACL|nr:DNA replication and repair protein RadC [Baia soyae]
MEYNDSQLLMRDVPADERPRERMIQLGAEHLSNAELIALLLRTGSRGESVLALAQRLLIGTNGLRNLHGSSLQELTKIRGIGEAKAIQILAGIEIGKRLVKHRREELVSIQNPETVAEYLMEDLRYLPQEHFVCLYLNVKNKIIHKKDIFIGGLNSSIVHPRDIFREGIRYNAASIICAHNHPSGDPTPSPEDLMVTQRLIEAGDLVGIEVVDHIIIGDGRFCSLRNEGLMFEPS